VFRWSRNIEAYNKNYQVCWFIWGGDAAQQALRAKLSLMGLLDLGLWTKVQLKIFAANIKDIFGGIVNKGHRDSLP